MAVDEELVDLSVEEIAEGPSLFSCKWEPERDELKRG